MRYSLLLMVLISGPLFASGDDIVQSNDMNNLTGDVSMTGSSNKAFGFGYAMGDVDIAQCLGSEQWGTILGGKQKLVLNWPCMAEFYLRNGMYDLASMAICNTEVLTEFESEYACEQAHDFEGMLLVVPPLPATGIPTPGPDEDGYRPDEVPEVSKEGYGGPPGTEIALMQLEIHQEEYSTLEERLARVESGQRAAAQKSQDRRDYAQMTIERLDNDPEE